MEQYGYFAGLDKTFSEWEKSRIAVLPVPYDKTSTWVKGADKGPLALIGASPALELYDIETDFEVYKCGIHTCKPLETNFPPEEMIRQIGKRVEELIDLNKFVVTLGGEHSVSIGAAGAHNGKFKNLCVLQLDAHSDLRDEYEGSRYNHACIAARIKEICPVVQVGIRSMCIEEKYSLFSNDIFLAKDIVESDNWIKRAIGRLADNVYVTIDLDVFDPAFMPATGTPEPGGLNWYQVTKLLKSVSEKRNVVGFDVVELCPIQFNRSPDFLAAKLVYKFLSYIFKKKKTKG